MKELAASYACGCALSGGLTCPTHGAALKIEWPGGNRPDHVRGAGDGNKMRPPTTEPRPRYVLIDPEGRASRECPFTQRELEIAGMCFDGASDAQIAAALGISPNTVRSHITKMVGKVSVGFVRATPDVKPRARLFAWFRANMLESEAASTKTFVYFIQAVGGGNHIKIGISVEPYDRLASLQTTSPLPLKMIGFFRASPEMEASLHRQFAASRLHGEWFKPAPDLLQFVEETLGPLERNLIAA